MIKINTKQNIKTEILPITPKLELTIPIIGGIIAPPTIAITSNPDISLALDGILLIAIENTSGKRFPAPKPRIKIAVSAMTSEVENKIKNAPTIAKIVVTTRKKFGLKNCNKIAPENLLIIKAVK